MSSLSADQFLARATDLPREKVTLPELRRPNDAEDPHVWVHTLSADELDEYEASRFGKATDPKAMPFGARLRGARRAFTAAVCRDDEGRLIFTGEAVARLGSMSSKVINRILEVAGRLNNFADDDLELLAKKSDAGPASASA